MQLGETGIWVFEASLLVKLSCIMLFGGGVLCAQWEKIPGDPSAPGDTGSSSGNETGTGDPMPIRTLAGIVVISAITAMILMGNRRRRENE